MTFDIKDCKNPAYTKDGRIDVDLFVTNDDGSQETMRFTADSKDTEVHGREIFSRAQALEYGPIKAYKP